MSGEIILAIIASSVGLIAIVAIMQFLLTDKRPKSGPVPDFPTIPPPPRIPRTATVRTQHGKSLLDLAEKIYLSDLINSQAHPGTKARLAVQKAHELLVEVEKHCSRIDEERSKKTREEFEKISLNKQSEGKNGTINIYSLYPAGDNIDFRDFFNTEPHRKVHHFKRQ